MDAIIGEVSGDVYYAQWVYRPSYNDLENHIDAGGNLD